ncbi:hypothetical protein C8R46DRAFT_1286652 [Mycena filopes]|nr:hypothetical protein C8R46DRAFT_1286652 [Mycena filopes]
MRSIFSIFSDAPLLREAHITGLAFDPFTLPWGQLTTLGLGGYSRESYAEILRHTPQIQILRLECGGGGDLFQPLPPAVAALTLHHLHTLELHGDRDGQDEEEALLHALTLPALRNLELAAVPMELEEAVVELLTRSHCSLASVSICSPSEYLYRHLAFHKAARTLDKIHITDLDWNPHDLNTLFLIMAHNAVHGATLPNLQTLSISSSRLVDTPYAAIAKMVTSRQGSEEGYAPLRSFHLTHPQVTPFQHDSEAFAMFRDATLQGCRVDVPGLNLGLNDDSRATHSYTLESPTHKF